MKTLACTAVAVLLSAHPAAAAVNLVTNGSFENGLAGWTIGGVDTDPKRRGGFPPAAITLGSPSAYPTGAYGEAVPANGPGSASPDQAGTRAAYFVSDFTVNQSLSQAVQLAKGNYQIGFSAYAPGNGYRNRGDARFSGTIGGVTLASYSVSAGPRQAWQNFLGNLTIASPGLYSVDFLFNTNLLPSKDVVIDQVYIIRSSTGGPIIPAVPEPTSWALLISGFGMIGVAIRRQPASA